MKFLIDTNIFIPVEPTSPTDVEAGTPVVAEFIRLSHEARQQVYVHPLVAAELGHDANAPRRELRKRLLAKYSQLPDPPDIRQIDSLLGASTLSSNDWVDRHLLAAVAGDAVDYLVTEDNGVHAAASRLRLQDRVLTAAEAVELVRSLFDRVPRPPPAVESAVAHCLDENDPIFQGLRADYHGFDDWLRKCKREHRQVWTVKLSQDQRLAAVCIVKHEQQPQPWMLGKTLKICTFKVAEDFGGLRLGELLLKTVMEYAAANGYETLFVTVFGKYVRLVDLLTSFGFEDVGQATQRGEMVLRKRLSYAPAERANLDALAFHIRYGPLTTKLESTPAFIVPIQSRYHALLFPEGEVQRDLFPNVTPFGNSIRKAYLCRSPITTIAAASHLFFYRSQDYKGLTALGIVEDTLRSQDPHVVARFVGKRTVYRFEEITRMCHKPVLAILFRQVRLIRPTIPLASLKARRLLRAAPQSIVSVAEEGKTWLQEQLGM